MTDFNFIIKKTQIDTLFFLEKTNKKYLKINNNLYNVTQKENEFLITMQELINYINTNSTQFAKTIKKTVLFFDIVVNYLCLINNYLLFKQHAIMEINLIHNLKIINDLFLSRFDIVQKKYNVENINVIYSFFCMKKNNLLLLLTKESISLIKKNSTDILGSNNVSYNLKYTDQHVIYYKLYQNLLKRLKIKLSIQNETLQKNNNIFHVTVLDLINEFLLNHLEGKISYITNYFTIINTKIPILNLIYDVIDRCCIYNFIIENNICNLTNKEFFLKRDQLLYTDLLIKNNGFKILNTDEYLFNFILIPLNKLITFPIETTLNVDHTKLTNESLNTIVFKLETFLEEIETYFLNEFLVYIFELTKTTKYITK